MTGPVPITAEGGEVLAGNGQQVAVPSGQTVTLQEVLWNVPGPDGLAARFRFVAPAIARDGGTVNLEAASADMLWLCQNFAIERISTLGPAPRATSLVICRVEFAWPSCSLGTIEGTIDM